MKREKTHHPVRTRRDILDALNCLSQGPGVRKRNEMAELQSPRFVKSETRARRVKERSDTVLQGSESA